MVLKPFWKWVLIAVGISIFVLAIFIALVLFLNISWWWFFGTLIFFGSGWFVSSIIYLIIKIFKKEPEKEMLNLEEIEEKVKFMMVTDTENPDNFMIKERYTNYVGEKGTEKNLIYRLDGYGTETMTKRVVLINMKNLKFTFLIDPLEEKIIKETIKLSEYQQEVEITEQIPTGTDIYGRPTFRIVTRKPTQEQIKMEKEKEEAIEKSNF